MNMSTTKLCITIAIVTGMVVGLLHSATHLDYGVKQMKPLWLSSHLIGFGLCLLAMYLPYAWLVCLFMDGLCHLLFGIDSQSWRKLRGAI
jgi:hypothetical protein